MLMRWNYPSDINRQSAVPLLWDLGPDPKATENKYWYLAPKGADSYREQFLKQSLFPPYTICGLDQPYTKIFSMVHSSFSPDL